MVVFFDDGSVGMKKSVFWWNLSSGQCTRSAIPRYLLSEGSVKDEMPGRRGQASTSCTDSNDMVVLEHTEKYFLLQCASVGWARAASRTWNC